MSRHPTRLDPAKRFVGVRHRPSGGYLHSYDLNDGLALAEARATAAASALFRDGSILEGGQIAVDAAGGVARMTAGRVYAAGHFVDVAERLDVPVAASGVVRIGALISIDVVTPDDDAALRGDIAGARSQGEPGADRLRATARWIAETEAPASNAGGDQYFFTTFTIIDGVVLSQTPPRDVFTDRLARYDRESNGHYIVSGWRVTPLGLRDGAQHFQISEGVINVWGEKIERATSLRVIAPENPTLARVDAEPHVAPSGGAPRPVTITTRRAPIRAVQGVTITRERTATITRGAFAGGSDLLADSSVVAVISVTQGAAVYVAGVDYALAGDAIDWLAGGVEPSPGSTYSVTYHYLDTVEPSAVTLTTITVDDAVPGSTLLAEYDWALPRVDVIAVDRDGAVHYVRGESALFEAVRPRAPLDWAVIATVTNRWGETAEVANTGTRAIPYARLAALESVTYDLLDLVAQERLKSDMDRRQPTTKRGVFVDPLLDDDLRDAGIAQTAAIVGQELQLPITATVTNFSLGAAVTLPWIAEPFLAQELATRSMKVNPYASFAPLPCSVHLDPAIDHWQEAQTVWASAVTRNVVTGRGDDRDLVSTTTSAELVRETTRAAEFLRERTVIFEIEGFGVGEPLESVTFDGLAVTPAVNPATGAPLVGDAFGRLSGVFVIPPGVPAGAKRVEFLGVGGTPGRATFIGSGTVTVTEMRQVTTATWNARPRDVQETGGRDGGNDGGGPDPLGQTFVLPEARSIAAVQIRFAAIGDPENRVVLQLRDTRDGVIRKSVIAEASIDMRAVAVGAWVTVNFPMPVALLADTEYAFILMTDDADHAVEIAGVGDFDTNAQAFVGEQAYQIGVLLSSSNASTWTAHQRDDMTFRIDAARFIATSRLVSIGSVALQDCSDLIIAAGVDEPSVATRVAMRITRADGSTMLAAPGQRLQFAEAITETVTIDAVLTGTALETPTLFPWVTVIAGALGARGDYVSRALPGGSPADPVKIIVTVETLIPATASLAVGVGGEGAWIAAPQHSATPLGDGWIEQNFVVEDFRAAAARVKLLLTGAPDARPRLRQIRANVTADPINIITGE